MSRQAQESMYGALSKTSAPIVLKSFRASIAALAIAATGISQAAVAQDCPNGPQSQSGQAKDWNIREIRDFALRASNDSNNQLMMCLHRGRHDNVNDNDQFGGITKGVPENSWRAIIGGFNSAPCIELDFQKRYLDKKARADGFSKNILSHELIADRFMSSFTMVLGANAEFPGICNPATLTAADSEGNKRVQCRGSSYYIANGTTSYFVQPQTQAKFESSKTGSLLDERTALTGSVRPFYSTDTDGTSDSIVAQKALFQWVNQCRLAGNVGLIVADMKTFASLEAFVEEMEDFYWSLPSAAARTNYARHWMVKTKPWKMRGPDAPGSFDSLKNLAWRLKRIGIPIIDTIAQQGVEGSDGRANVKTGVDYDAAEAYYEDSVRSNHGAQGLRAVELSVPGTSRYDPIASNALKMWFPTDCANTGAIQRDLSSMKALLNNCHDLPIAQSNFPQVWGWVPLEDGRAAQMYDRFGDSVITPGEQYVQIGGLYPFGIGSSGAAAFPFRLEKDNEERRDNFITDVLGARAITIDSISRFREMFPGYNRTQDAFMTVGYQ